MAEIENFFYGDRFCYDLSDLVDILTDGDDLEDIDDDWSIEVEESKLEKMFTMDKDFIVKSIVDNTERWDDRFPEDDSQVFKDIRAAIEDAVDIDKLNTNLPSLYYPTGNKVCITKEDLVGYL